ncbi:hypothetical protein ACFQ48_02705 [Hymenobacter caeli]|uniref:Uncharacterized protein n=1 Tax=Hymenobacter caeli TaxID=2735894 RepID=A0ABX2FLM1_9BACT|nr:hypothetical protein [Hymenobacter caeli]NRT17733.1 hypothetical protein [Hymenobacter caeli]
MFSLASLLSLVGARLPGAPALGPGPAHTAGSNQALNVCLPHAFVGYPAHEPLRPAAAASRAVAVPEVAAAVPGAAAPGRAATPAVAALPLKTVVVDLANNRMLIATTHPNGQAIHAVNLTTGASSLFFVPPAIAGALATRLVGLALDCVHDCLYYMLNDSPAPSPTNHLRRVRLDGTHDAPVRTTDASAPPAVDLAGNHQLLAAARADGSGPAGPLPGPDATGLGSGPLPTVGTTLADAITATSAVLGGFAALDGDGIRRGIVYSAFAAHPTLGNGTRVEIGSGPGGFSRSINLSSDTTYYVRAYATGAAGTVYGNTVMFKTLAPLAAAIVPRPGGSRHGGTATVVATGGSAPYTHSWRNTTAGVTLAQAGATVLGLSAGCYTVTVTDSTGATTTASTVVL